MRLRCRRRHSSSSSVKGPERTHEPGSCTRCCRCLDLVPHRVRAVPAIRACGVAPRPIPRSLTGIWIRCSAKFIGTDGGGQSECPLGSLPLAGSLPNSIRFSDRPGRPLINSELQSGAPRPRRCVAATPQIRATWSRVGNAARRSRGGVLNDRVLRTASQPESSIAPAVWPTTNHRC